MKKVIKVYEIVILMLALLTVILVILDISNKIPEQYMEMYRVVDLYIWIIFVIDYVTRLIIAKEKWEFIKSNVFNLLAIIPFNSIFRAFRIVRVLKIFRTTFYLSRLMERARPFLNTNGLIYVIWITVLMTIIGGGIVSYIEPNITS